MDHVFATYIQLSTLLFNFFNSFAVVKFHATCLEMEKEADNEMPRRQSKGIRFSRTGELAFPVKEEFAASRAQIFFSPVTHRVHGITIRSCSTFGSLICQ